MQNRVYLRLLLSFIIVASFYTLIIAVSLVRSTYSQQRADAISQIKSNLQQEADISDQQLSATNDTILSLTEKSSLQNLVQTPPTGYHPYARVYDDIMANPDYANFSSQYAIGIVRHANGRVISSDGFFQFEPYLKYMEVASLKPQVSQFFKKLPDNGIRVLEANDHVLLLRNTSLDGGKQPLTFLTTWEKSELAPLNIYNNKGQLKLLDTLNPKAKKTLPEIKHIADAFNHAQASASSVMQQQVGGDQYFVRQSNIIPTIMYTYVISNRELSQMPAHLVMMLVLYFFALLLVGGLLVYILTRRSFRPYAKIIDEVQQIDSNVRPQNAEVLLEKIHDLVESNHQYASMQNDVTHDLKLLFLKNLLLNSYSQKDISRFADLLALDELQNGGVIGILTFSQIALSEEPLGINERKDARKKNIVALWPKPLNLLFDIDVNHYAILSEHGPNTTDDFVHTLNHTAVQLSKRLKIPVHALISIPFHNLNEIPVRFADVYSTATATPEDVTTKPTAIMLSNGVYTVETEAAILASVSQRDFAKADQLLDQALSKTLTANRPTLASLTNIKFVFLNTLKRTLDSVGLSVTDFIDENRKVVNQLDLETSPTQVKTSIMTLFHDAFDRISKLSKHHRTLEEHIVDYIARRYTSDLALSEIADHYHLSESHTSRLIKEHLGISFKDYLIQLRMRQAKTLLNETDQKVADIAEAVGYKNVNTFIRVFKATTGQTPGKFRRSTDID